MDICFIERYMLLTISKTFIHPHPDYRYINYDQADIVSLTDTMESNQYNSAIIITGTTRGTSGKKNCSGKLSSSR